MNAINLSGTVQTEKIGIRKMPDGTPVTSFVLKVNSETEKNKYELITVVCWNKMAEYAAKNLVSGTAVSVKGSIHIGKRKLKGYDVSKNGVAIPDFQVPFCEVNAVHVEKM